jgi:hypothetical protein
MLGFESEVLRGAGQTLSRPELKAIISEDRSSAVTSIVQAAGFVEQNYDPFARLLAPGRNEKRRQNALFVRDKEFVQQRLIGAPRIRIFDKWL